MQTASLETLDLVGLIIDGVHIGEHCLIVALGIAADGQKHALGLWDGSTENARVCQDLLANLQSRPAHRPQSAGNPRGSKALRKAVRATFGEAALVQRCQIHKTRNMPAATHRSIIFPPRQRLTFRLTARVRLMRPKPLTTTRGFAAYPVWSPDGKRMAYAYQPTDEMDDVYLKDIGSGGSAPLIEAPRTIELPMAWSHDGRWLLAFTSDETRDVRVVVVVRCPRTHPCGRSPRDRRQGILLARRRVISP